MTSPTARGGWTLGHRPGLDGARGLAVALVLVGHALPSGFAAASVGVALFFVLSGFLITSLLWEERQATGAVDLRRFYERRIRRLVPAFVLCWVAVLASMFVIGRVADGLFNGFVAASYVGNWVLAGGQFIGPLSHTWSLAIEEQFYFVWPLALIAAARYLRPVPMLVLLVSLAAAAQVARWASWISAEVGWERIAFGTDLQADGLLLGCALAIVMHARPFRMPSIVRPLGVAALVAISFIVPDGLYRGLGNTAAVLVSTMLVAALVSPSGRDILFGNRVLASLGLISYGVYLWHYPVLWHLGFFDRRPYPGLELAFVGVAVSVTIASASYVWVEQRFRRPSARHVTDQRVAIPEPVAA